MYAIIKTGGKQYRVEQDDVIEVELLKNEGDEVIFDTVLLMADGKKLKLGAPCLEGAQVVGESLGITKGPKVISFKYKRRKNYHRKIGHRQKYNRVRIKEIKG